ncbi:MAG: peptide-methionine (R)-S-oxide reductase MsrB [Proteobacteria bacterium]|nr:peptide-methionine (R)-S-oxide reductase MsrB [Pseudomonadota bacterium]MBI3499778.1 peptide-methionine (R)-S-oxide reductase MsrB [Pseudomonadota bacterium]
MAQDRSPKTDRDTLPLSRSEADWRRLLTPQQYRVLRARATEPAGSSPLNRERRTGTFHCAGCQRALFDAEAKFDSGTGWPSFRQALPGAVRTLEDRSQFLVLTEACCSHCGCHLGHLYADDPPGSGQSYRINGTSLAFRPR